MSKKRVGYFDALNVVSCIAVVTMHVMVLHYIHFIIALAG